MFKECNLGFNSKSAREPSQIVCTQDAVARDDQGDRVSSAALADSLRAATQIFGNFAIGLGLAERDFGNSIADVCLKRRMGDAPRQVERSQPTFKIAHNLSGSFIEQGGRCACRIPPRRANNLVILFPERKRSSRR